MTGMVVSPRRLLLIADSPPFHQTLARLLRVAGHTVWEAQTGAAGLAILRQHPVDLVVTDRDMPGLTGEDVARLIQVTYPQLSVVLMTGGTGSVAPNRQTPAPVSAILWKPFSFAELLAVIDRLTREETLASFSAVGNPATGQIGKQFQLVSQTPDAPIGWSTATSQPHRRMRRRPTLSGR